MRLFRPINLLIIGIIQVIVQYCVIRPHMPEGVVLFEHWQFALIVLITICTGAAGYVVNDIYDIDIDAHNKPGKNVIGQISKRKGWIIYSTLVGIGAIMTFLLGEPYATYGIMVYGASVLMLWAYSAYFKRQALTGNIIVSLFGSMVVYVVWLGQSIQIPEGDEATYAHSIVLMYVAFAFLSTLTREVVKDIEDVEGDKRYGAQTLPVVIGTVASKYISIALVIFLICGIGFWQFEMAPHLSQLANIFLIVCVTLPLVSILWFLVKARSEKDWHFISQYIKIIILSGTLFLLLI